MKHDLYENDGKTVVHNKMIDHFIMIMIMSVTMIMIMLLLSVVGT